MRRAEAWEEVEINTNELYEWMEIKNYGKCTLPPLHPFGYSAVLYVANLF
jgi:hypothetical protein